MYKIILLLIFYCNNLIAQESEVLTNKSIIELKNAGFNKSTIKNMINSSTTSFSLDIKSVIELKKNNVDEEVIDAMIQKTKQKNTNSILADKSSNIEKKSPIIEQLQSLGTGVYYLDGESLVELEPTVYSQSKQGSGILTSLTYGISKTKSKSSVSGTKANIQIKEKRPIFYFYFLTESKNLNEQSAYSASASNPNEFLLIRFNISKNSREVVTGTSNAYEGAAGGIDDANKQSYKYKKIAPGIYQVYFENQIIAGEYGFMYAGATAQHGNTSPKVYDFGVQ